MIATGSRRDHRETVIFDIIRVPFPREIVPLIATPYDGPTALETMSFGPSTILLARPSDPDRLLSDPEVLDLNRRDDYMPYWAYLWPGALLLAEAVSREGWPPGTRALELGCGLGLAGLVGVDRGLSVVFSDYDEAPLRFVRESLAANGFGPDRGSTARVDWRAPPAERFPVILGADVLYERRLVPLVCDAIAAMLAPGGEAIVAGPYRVATEDLGACLASRGLVARAEAIEAAAAGHPPARGTLHRIRHADE